MQVQINQCTSALREIKPHNYADELPEEVICTVNVDLSQEKYIPNVIFPSKETLWLLLYSQTTIKEGICAK